MKQLLKEIRHNPLLWLLVFVPVVFAAAKLKPGAHTLLFVLLVLTWLAALQPYVAGVRWPSASPC